MSTSSNESIATNARMLVAREQVRQSAIAEELGLSQSQVSRRLAGVTKFSADELQRLAQLLNVSVTELYGEQVPA
jgi:transcriptional regulator with XRE-family HTH domain